MNYTTRSASPTYLGWGLVLNWQIQLELCWQLILRVESVREVHSPNPAIGVDLEIMWLQ